MRGRLAALGLLNLGLALFLPASPVRADFTIVLPTATIDSTQTNFGPTTVSLLGKDPFTIAQFDPSKIVAPARGSWRSPATPTKRPRARA